MVEKIFVRWWKGDLKFKTGGKFQTQTQLVLRRLRHEASEFQANLGYIVQNKTSCQRGGRENKATDKNIRGRIQWTRASRFYNRV